MGETNHDAIFARVQKLFERMHQNQKLQKLAKENGMDVKNNAELTDDTINNLAVSIIALSLAKDANDPRYGKLVNTGLQKRSLKIEIINDYKDEANRLIGEYNNGNFQEMTKGCDVDSADVYINEAVDTSLSKPIFVVLEGSNDPISLAIKMYTKSRFSHVMLAFDLELNDLYGFDTSFRRDPETGNRHGFHRETFRSTYSNKDITVYAAYVSNDSYSKMKEYVESFKNTKKSGKYDWSIILNCLLNIDKKYTKSEYTQVCSTFVDAIFKQINVDLTGKTIPSPKDLGIAISDRKPEFKLLYDGIGSDYNPKSLKSKLRSFTKTKYSKQLDATENFQEGFLDIFKPKPTNTTATNYNPNNGSGSEKQNWKRAAGEVASKWIDKNLPTDVSKLINGDTDRNFDNKYFEITGCKYTFKKNMYDVTDSEGLGDWMYDTLTKEFLLYHSGEIDNTDDLESLFETHKDEIPCLHIIEGELRDNTEYVIAYDFTHKEYFMFKHDDVYTDKRNDIKLGKSWTSFMKSLKDE